MKLAVSTFGRTTKHCSDINNCHTNSRTTKHFSHITLAIQTADIKHISHNVQFCV